MISDEEREVVFTDFVDDAFSSLDTEYVESWKGSTAIPRQHDVSGLRSIDLDVHHPQVIGVEMHGFDINRPHEKAIYRHLAARNYRLAGFLVLNGYFVLSDRPLLSPETSEP